MGTVAVPPLTLRRRGRAYLLLARVSNLPTVWTNVMAGMLATGAPLDVQTFARIGVAISLFYSGGMVLNDAFDADYDRTQRPERPIPAGTVGRREAFLLGGVLLAIGELALAPSPVAIGLGVLLAAAIVLYDYRHKRITAAPLVMGVCRGLVYLIAGAAAGALGLATAVGAVMMTLYIVGLTVVARHSGAKARWRVPLMLAAISLVDAAFILAVTGSLPLTALAAAAFPVTLFLQRFAPGD